MKIIRDGKEIELTREELVRAYKEEEINCKVEEIQCTCGYMGVHGMKQGDYEVLAERFLDQYDGQEEMNTIENMIGDYAERERNNGRDISID